MKKKIIMVLMAGAVTLNLAACGDKAAKADAEQTQETATQEETAKEDETKEKVSERPDYVALEDLKIEEYVTIPDYASMTVKAEKPEVTDEVIENFINRNLLTSYPVTDRKVAEGDAVKIDYVGKKDGVAFDGGTAQGYVLNIGSHTFIDGFEDGLIGVMPGETVDLNLTFPEEYPAQELAGAEVVFTVTVHEIQESADYASVTEEQLALMDSEYTSKEAVWESAKKSVEENAELSYQNNIGYAVMDNLMAESKFISMPEHLVEEELQNYNEYMEAMCEGYYGVDVETFVTNNYGIPMEEYNAQARQMCEATVNQYLVIEAVARAEGIEVSEDMIQERAAEEAEEFGYASAEELLDSVGRGAYRMYILQDKVMTKLKDMVTVEELTEETATEEASAETAQ